MRQEQKRPENWEEAGRRHLRHETVHPAYQLLEAISRLVDDNLPSIYSNARLVGEQSVSVLCSFNGPLLRHSYLLS